MKTFLSIGTGPGMGFATAERFAREGFRVVLSARTPDRTAALVARLKARGVEAEGREVDASSPTAIAALVAEVGERYGPVDVLHYNAAAMRKADVQEQPADTFVSDLATNIGGALAATQAVADGMLQRRSGTILFTGGGYAIWPHPDFLSLSIGKAGIRALALGLFDSFRDRGVHVATVTVVAATIDAGSPEAAAVAEHFWQLHQQPPGLWEPEVTYKPA